MYISGRSLSQGRRAGLLSVPAAAALIRRATGALFVGLGVRLAVST